MNILCTHIQSTNGLFCTGYLATSRSYRETLQAKLIDERTFIIPTHYEIAFLATLVQEHVESHPLQLSVSGCSSISK
mgnify:CR=1 FL=1